MGKYATLSLSSSELSKEEKLEWVKRLDNLLDFAGRPGDWGRNCKLGVITEELIHLRNEIYDLI